jgi:Trypsin-co-occurring domain 2
MANDENQPVGLAEAIQSLREEMTRAIEQAKGQELRFNVEEVEIDLGVEVKREGSADGKISFKVFGTGIEAGGKGSQAQTSTHHMKITLKPPAGSIQVSDEGRGRPK